MNSGTVKKITGNEHMNKFKHSRDLYLVLAFVFFNNGLTGISALSIGIKRIIDTNGGEVLIDHHECVLNVCLFSDKYSGKHYFSIYSDNQIYS